LLTTDVRLGADVAPPSSSDMGAEPPPACAGE
jgi:hypothetical protein